MSIKYFTNGEKNIMEFNTSAIESPTAKAVVPAENQVQVADIRTKTEENEGAGAGQKTEEQKATAPAEAEKVKADGEKATRKETALAAGKTEEEFEAEETAANDNKGKTLEEIAAAKKLVDDKTTQDAANKKLLDDAKAEFLKSMGVNSEEELRAKLNPKKPKTDDEIAQDREIYATDLAKFAVKNKVFTNDELLTYQNMSKMPDSDLVFKEFEANYKEANKDRKVGDEKDPVTADEVKDKFNELYHLDSENKALKEQGEKNIGIKAKSLRQPLEEKYNDIKEIYDDEQAQAQAVPEFKKFFQGVLNKAIPESLTYGEGDNKTVVGLDKLDKLEFEKNMIASIGDREFAEFRKGNGSPEQRARIEKEITKELLYQNHEAIAKQALENGISIGTKKTAPGSETRFIEPAKQQQQAKSVKVTAEDNKKIAESIGKI